jgi:hypothetical protein
MPMMVHAVAEASDYDLPLSDINSGSYSVDWRARSGDREYRGSVNFVVL